jgi:hypothetical protein
MVHFSRNRIVLWFRFVLVYEVEQLKVVQVSDNVFGVLQPRIRSASLNERKLQCLQLYSLCAGRGRRRLVPSSSASTIGYCRR